MLIERVVDFENYLVRLPAKARSEDALVFFHGFPSYRGVKNLDVALAARDALDRDVFLIHYKGLGESPGNFLFTTAIRESQHLVAWLAEKKGYRQLHLVGHSFGGLVAVNCALAHPQWVRSLLLISPFCFIEKTDPLYEWFWRGVRAEVPGIFGEQSSEEVRLDVDNVLANHLPLHLAAKIPAPIQIGILQSKPDVVTPAKTTQAFAAKLQNMPMYLELDQDHGFAQNREEFSLTINKMLRDLIHV